MNKLAAVFVLALVGAVALPAIDVSAQTGAPSTSSSGKKGKACGKFTAGTPEYQNCMDKRAKNAEAKRQRQAACAQFKAKTQERKDCMAQQKRSQKTATRPS
jgi:hypothetical protein